MTNKENRGSATDLNIRHQLYFWHSLADIRALEQYLGCGIPPTDDYMYLIEQAFNYGSSIPKFQDKEAAQQRSIITKEKDND